jgi:chromosome segregation ATPase
MIEDMKVRLDEYEREYNEMKEIRDLEAEIRSFEQQLAWSYVRHSRTAFDLSSYSNSIGQSIPSDCIAVAVVVDCLR